MKSILIILIALLPAGIFAQSITRQVIGSSGGFASATGQTVSFTTGETVVATYSQSGLILTQGFQQSETQSPNGLNEMHRISSVTAYPNPARDEISIDINADESMDLQIQVLDLQGRMVLPASRMLARPGPNTHRLDLSGLAAGQYLVVLNGKVSRLGTFKVQKID